MVVYELENTVRPIASMIPGAVSCKKVSCANALIWSPPRMRAAGGGADDDLHDDDDDDGGVESDDVAPSEASDDAIARVAAPLSEVAALAEAYVEALDDGADVGDELRDVLADGAALGEVGAAAEQEAAPYEDPCDAADALMRDLEPEPAAASSVAEPPPPPRPIGARRARASAEVALEGGVMNFYLHDGRFTATCENPFHGQCVLTRHIGTRSHCKGRPVGLMAAWLSAGPMCESKKEHWDLLQDLSDDRAWRSSARDRVLAAPGGRQMAQFEAGNASGDLGELGSL
jgi:hypothetical protein